MRFATVHHEGRDVVAARVDGVLRAVPGEHDLRELISRGPEALARAHAAAAREGAVLDEDRVTFLPPIPRPGKIVCVGLNYLAHAQEASIQKPDFPVIFSRYPASLNGHGVPIVRPRISEQLDFEGELAVIIGKPGRHIPAERALEHVAGYSVMNEGTVREYQFKSPQWLLGKSVDRTGGFGPEMVTADAVAPGGRGLRITTTVNGTTMQDATTSDMMFDIPTLIAIVSGSMRLEPGDVIATGTPGGVGAARNPKLWLKPGDEVAVSVETIGTLRNRVIDEA
jgi:2-keto-4-pentenoate hydratase/2-oxohepta-3-ene-1,7-dioic acid hydratase in catechol pathway